MKATIEFNLPEEQEEFRLCTQAGDTMAGVWNFDQELRSAMKYNSHPEWDSETVDKIRTLLHELIPEIQ